MRRILLGTSAIVAVGLMAVPAAAEVTLRISGDVEFQAGWADTDVDTERDYDFRTIGNVILTASGQADNGLTYSAVLDLDDIGNNAGDDIVVDEMFVTVGGTWGVVTLGDDDGAAGKLWVAPPTAGTGIIDGDYADFIAGTSPSLFWDPADTSDATKITYVSPVFGGFSAGASFVPDSGSEGPDVDFDTVGDFEDVFELGATWAGTFGGFNVSAGAAANFGNGVAGDDLNSWGVGATAGFGAFAAGATWVDNGDLDTQGINLGATYSMGAWNFGAGASWGDDDDGDDDFAWGLAADYTLAPGLTLAADAVWFNSDDTAGEDDGTVVLVSTKVAF